MGVTRALKMATKQPCSVSFVGLPRTILRVKKGSCLENQHLTREYRRRGAMSEQGVQSGGSSVSKTYEIWVV